MIQLNKKSLNIIKQLLYELYEVNNVDTLDYTNVKLDFDLPCLVFTTEVKDVSDYDFYINSGNTLLDISDLENINLFIDAIMVCSRGNHDLLLITDRLPSELLCSLFEIEELENCYLLKYT